MDNSISSASNPTVHHLRKLASSGKYRTKERRYIADGAHLVRSYLDAGGVPELYAVAESAQENEEVAELADRLRGAGARPVYVKDGLYESFSDVHASVGISIVCVLPEREPTEVLASDAVLLENVQDPGNIGTILRTAAAAGVGVVYVSAGSASVWSPKALRAGMGAQFNLAIYESADVVQVARQASVPVYGTLLSTDSVGLYSLDLTTPAAWVFGSEGQGVSSELAAAVHTRVTIPQAKTSVESLNVAAAAAVCLYEQLRQRI